MNFKNYFIFCFVAGIVIIPSTVSKTLIARGVLNTDSEKCQILTTTKTSPLLVHTGTTTMIYPDSESNVTTLETKQTVDVSCPGPANKIIINQQELGSLESATCMGDDLFLISGESVKWINVTCKKNATVTVVELKSSDLDSNHPMKDCSDDKLKIASIGYDLDTTRHLDVAHVCFDFISKIALYSSHYLSSLIYYRATGVNRITFSQDDSFYRVGMSIDKLYKNFQSTINDILGLAANDDQYFSSSKINRGHLAPMADFLFAQFQQAMFRYINVAPQWDTINGGNWNQIEEGVRNYASLKKVDLQIWTGVTGTASLKNKNNELTEIYLYFNKQDKRSPFLPVPEAFWKFVYEPVNKTGIILVSHNNPYENNTQKICKDDISDQINWIKWNKTNIQKGLSYACRYDDSDFQNSIKYFPRVKVTDVLV